MSYIAGITIIQDTGISSDHDLIITKCNFGTKIFEFSKGKEENLTIDR